MLRITTAFTGKWLHVRMDGVMQTVSTSQVCALGEQQQLQWLSDVTEVVQHVLQVFLVLFPSTMNKDKAGHLHCPACKMDKVPHVNMLGRLSLVCD